MREVRGIHPVEVVDVVAAHEEEQGASEELQCVPCSIEVPHRGRRPETHGVVEYRVGPEAVCKMVPLWDGTLTGHWR